VSARVEVYDKHTAGAWYATVSSYEALLHGWQSHAILLTFLSVDGAEITIRRNSVTAIVYVDAATDAVITDRLAREKLENA
jgi:hypothetical protein